MNIKTAFINDNHEKEIDMDQPIGYVSKGQEDKVCHPKRPTYDLKQSNKS